MPQSVRFILRSVLNIHKIYDLLIFRTNELVFNKYITKTY